jgi:hypothetical protein
VIRSAGDRGVVALLDARFARPDYRCLLPAYWAVRFVDDATRLSRDLKVFWAQMDGAQAPAGNDVQVTAPVAVT